MIIIFVQTPLSWNNFFGGMGGGTDSSSWVLGDNFGGESPLAWKINLKLFQNNPYKPISISRNIWKITNDKNKNLTGETLPVPAWSKFDDDVTIVGEVVEVNDVVSMAVKEEKVLILLLRLLENVILPSEKNK